MKDLPSKYQNRAVTVCDNNGIEFTKEAVKKAIESGKINVIKGGPFRNYGVKTHRWLCEWSGAKFETKHKRSWMFDPFTGKPFVSKLDKLDHPT